MRNPVEHYTEQAKLAMVDQLAETIRDLMEHGDTVAVYCDEEDAVGSFTHSRQRAMDVLARLDRLALPTSDGACEVNKEEA